jgi:osomolarity two-component system sensor histidine kinase SLN1
VATRWVEFRVIDTGRGVPENMQQKIFEPFVQADVGSSRKYGGTGLGLSICQQLSKLMGGDIHLKSFEGAGSTLALRIPMQYSASLSAAGSSQRCCRPRSVTRSRRSAHTTTSTTRSLSAFSGAAFSGRSTHEAPTAPDGNMRLVGLSQPFFVPSRAESMNDYGMADQADATARSSGEADEGAGKQVQHHPPTHPPMMTPVTEVTTPGTTPGTGKGPPRTEFPMRVDGPSDSEGKSGPGVSIVSEEVSERNVTDEEEEEEEEDKTIRVLVVEDNKINQKLVVKVLQLEKVQEITVAEDGLQAVDKVKEVMAKGERFDIIFMDIQVLSSLPRRGRC